MTPEQWYKEFSQRWDQEIRHPTDQNRTPPVIFAEILREAIAEALAQHQAPPTQPPPGGPPEAGGEDRQHRGGEPCPRGRSAG